MLDVGRIVRPHGLKGEVVAELTSNRPERVAPNAELHSSLGVLRVLSARPFVQHPGRFIVRFEGYVDRPGAEALRDLVLSAPPVDDDNAVFVHELVGRTVVDAYGVERGAVTAVQDNPAHELLVLDSGALVPVVFLAPDALRDSGIVHVVTPPGLFELTEADEPEPGPTTAE